MRTLQEINSELQAAKEELANVEGTTAEVYSRIVGYYRSVRNWNKGKREEYGERKLFDVTDAACKEAAEHRILLFVRPACPNCPSAKAAASKLGLQVDMVNADTEEGLAEAAKMQVMSTPTAILLSKDGKELCRARDSGGIAKFSSFVEKIAS